MYIVYDIKTGDVISVSGFRGDFTDEMIDSIHLVDGLKEGQGDLRLYDRDKINALWIAVEEEKAMKVENGDVIVL